MMSLKALLFTVTCLLATQLVASELPTFKRATLPCHRLPINVKPTSYDLRLKFPSLDSDVYEGQVDIDVAFLNSKAKMLAAWGLEDVTCAKQYDKNTIVLHADKSLEIQSIKVFNEPLFKLLFGHDLKELEIEELVRDESKQMIAIKVKNGIHASSHGIPGRIHITFKGRVRNDKRGVYLSTYNDGKQEYKHIVSQFQPTFARTAFPCFDEPRFRVPFSVRISHPKELTAYGNTDVLNVGEEDSLAVTNFVTTPDMPVQMVAFTAGQFDKPLEVVSVRSKRNQQKFRKIRVITAPGKQDAGNFALAVARRSLEWFEKYIDYDFPLDKLDVIAIADLARDNTESWGLVFVRDTLLWIDDETKPETQVTTALNIAHVVAHQWFGNLISVNWWSDLWITEGVAAQFSFNIVQELYYFQSEYLKRLGILSGVMEADQAGNLHPLSPSDENLQTSDQIYSIFDKLEFMKSASMAQMIQEAVNSIEYQKILRKLIQEHAHKTIKFEDYKNAVLSSNAVLTVDHLLDLLESFPKYTGVPVINCIIDHKSLFPRSKVDLEPLASARFDPYETLSRQEQKVTVKIDFMAQSSSSKYASSMRIIRSADNGYLNGHRLPEWFSLEGSSQDFIKVDHQPSIATYYRVRYGGDLYDRLMKAIKKRDIWPMDRLQILDDANSLAKAKLIVSLQFKFLLDSYANEDDPAVVMAILSATNTLRGLDPERVNSLESNKAILSIFEQYGFEVSGNENVIMQRAREVVLTSLIKEGNKQVIDAALEAFDQANGQVALFLREPVYTAIVLSGSSEQVNQLLSHLTETKSYEEKIRLVAALTLSKDKEVLTKVKSWLGSSGLKVETTKPFLDTISAALSQ